MRKLGRPGIKDHENGVTMILRVRSEVATVRKLPGTLYFAKLAWPLGPVQLMSSSCVHV